MSASSAFRDAKRTLRRGSGGGGAQETAATSAAFGRTSGGGVDTSVRAQYWCLAAHNARADVGDGADWLGRRELLECERVACVIPQSCPGPVADLCVFHYPLDAHSGASARAPARYARSMPCSADSWTAFVASFSAPVVKTGAAQAQRTAPAQHALVLHARHTGCVQTRPLTATATTRTTSAAHIGSRGAFTLQPLRAVSETSRRRRARPHELYRDRGTEHDADTLTYATPAPTATRSLNMMFDALAEKMEETLRRVRGADKITENNVEATLKEVRRALLDADVNLRVVNDLVKRVKNQALGADVVEGVSPGQQLIKIVNDELVTLMGSNQVPLAPANARGAGKPTVILLAGLQGTGKTTAAAKLARYCGSRAVSVENGEASASTPPPQQQQRQEPRKVLMVAADVYRPAAVDQLATLGKQISVDVFTPDDAAPNAKSAGDRDGDAPEPDPVHIVKRGIEYAAAHGYDTVIVDTAGRQVIDEPLMDELRRLQRSITPDETLLVIDAMTGQEAANVTCVFNDAIGLSGAILTKMDGDTRGGAALSVRHVSGAPIKFVGTGEQVTKLEPFHPDRMASRILGMGDVVTLVERAKEAVDEKEAERMAQKMMDASFDFNDFIKQTRFIKQMGSFAGVLKMLPGAAGAMKGDQMEQTEQRLRVAETIINSMTKRERAEPDLLIRGRTALSRMQRMARGSGRSQHDVRQLMSDFQRMRSTMAQMSKSMAGKGGMPFSGGGGGAFDPATAAGAGSGAGASNGGVGGMPPLGNRSARRKSSKKKSAGGGARRGGFGK